MTFPRTRAKPAGWATNELLTSSQQNDLDILASEGIGGMAADGLEMESRSVTRTCWQLMAPGTASEWTSIFPAGATTAVNTVAFGYFMLDMPHGCTLTGLSIRIAGNTGHGGLPATKPKARLWKKLTSTNVSTQIGSTITDAPADVAAYETFHVLGAVGGLGPTFSGLTEVIDNSLYSYWLDIQTEGSTNALAGMIVTQPVYTATVTALDAGA